MSGQATSARAKIEWLTNNWYGFAVVSAALTFFSIPGLFFAGFITAIVFSATLFTTWLFGKFLLAKSSVTRLFLTVVSVFGVVVCAGWLSTQALAFIVTWKLITLAHCAGALGGIVVYGRSFRVLTDKSVKAYIAS
jgi:hypothetical protein